MRYCYARLLSVGNPSGPVKFSGQPQYDSEQVRAGAASVSSRAYPRPSMRAVWGLNGCMHEAMGAPCLRSV